MWIKTFLSLMFLAELNGHNETHSRQRRYLIFTPSTQWGVFATIAIPLHSKSTVSMAWFFEANYYNVDNATYLEPLLGDIYDNRQFQSSSRSNGNPRGMFSRAYVYTAIEDMLERYGYPGRACLLRIICEGASAMLHHNGILGDLLHLVLTPSTSMAEENIKDVFYKAEYFGLEERCEAYERRCPNSPLDLITLLIEKVSS